MDNDTLAAANEIAENIRLLKTELNKLQECDGHKRDAELSYSYDKSYLQFNMRKYAPHLLHGVKAAYMLVIKDRIAEQEIALNEL